MHEIFTATLAAIAVLTQSADSTDAAADKAYSPPATEAATLPTLPPAPELSSDSYPECREAYQAIEAPFDKAEEINKCTVALDAYYTGTLIPFREQMIDHQNALSQLYTNEVGGNRAYKAVQQQQFYDNMMREHKASDPDGANFEAYRAAEARYNADRKYLADRFCFNTGCGGYPVPEYVAAKDDDGDNAKSKKDRKTASKSNGPQKCRKARKTGGVLGGILGGIAGDAAGLGNIGSIIASGVTGVIGAEIACKLTEKEQVVAAEATVAVTQQEEVGATATWKSPTRAGVSGSSTITALNTQPNGQKCLNITDVAIIDGQETRVSKKMCRGKGDGGYSIA